MKIFAVFYRISYWPKLHLSATLLLIVCLLSGCIKVSPHETYENADFDISLEKPNNWEVTYDERSGIIVLESKHKKDNINSAHIEIHHNACAPLPKWFNGPREEIESNIERIRVLYKLDSVKIIQEPTMIESETAEITKAIISIPTMALPDDSVANQLGRQDVNLFQTIILFVIEGNKHYTMAYIYEGNSDELNSEAENIVLSIRLTCID